MDGDNQINGERTPSAWLVTGGRMFKDRAFISEAGAIKSAQERGDGASVEPLYLDDQLPPAPVAEELKSISAEERLSNAGVFKGAEGLRRLADADEFWESQNYGTRLYFGPGASDYLHRGVLRTAIELLDSAAVRPAVPDVKALAEFIDSVDAGNDEESAKWLAERIFNWIEEQQNDQ